MRTPYLISFLLFTAFFSCKNDKRMDTVVSTSPSLPEAQSNDATIEQAKDADKNLALAELKVDTVKASIPKAPIVKEKVDLPLPKKKPETKKPKPSVPKAKKRKPKPAKAVVEASVPTKKEGIPISKIEKEAKEFQRLENQTTELVWKRNFFSFGEIVQGDTIYFKYQFTNIGNVPLVIKDATATCGCTHPTYPFTPISPGESGEITGMYVSNTKQGPQNAMVKVVANTAPSIHKLSIDGTVLLPSELEEETAKENEEDEGKGN